MSQSERITISNDGTGMNQALELTRKIADSSGLVGRENFHLCLLSEELLSMVRAIVGKFSAEFWIESENRDFRIRLEARGKVDYAQKQDLISVSTRGKNSSSFGIMDKVREMLEGFTYNMEESFKFQTEYGSGFLDYGTLGMTGAEISQAVYSWSMQKYKQSISDLNANSQDEAASEAWDELEKSIIANIADDVQIGVKNNVINVTILKKF